MRNYNKIVLSFVLVLFFSLNIYAQQKTESVSFKVTTTSPGGNFSPRNIGAIWIEDVSGAFVKTLQLWANKRIQYLYTWNSTSNNNQVDALTSATLSSHQSHNVTWNVTNYLGNAVPDGQYVLKIEMTDQHSQGPISSYTFPIGEATNTLSFPEETYFHDIELSWSSILTDIDNEKMAPSRYELVQNYPNPFNPTTTIGYTIPSGVKSETANVKIVIYDVLGSEIAILVNEKKSAGNYEVSFDATNLPSGIYYYQLQAGEFLSTQKMILLK